MADSVTITGSDVGWYEDTPADFTATFDYDGLSTLCVTLTNETIDATSTGAITALAFQKGAATSVSLTGQSGDLDSDTAWAQFGSGLDTPPPGGSVGFFDVALAVGGGSTANDWMGAGDGSDGIEVGETVKFTFNVVGGAGLSVMNFLTANPEGARMAIRVKGVGSPPGDSDTAVLVPLPPAAWMGMAGLLGAGVLRRRFR